VLCLSIKKKKKRRRKKGKEKKVSFLPKRKKKKRKESTHSRGMLTIVGVKPQLIQLPFLGCFVINYGATELQIILWFWRVSLNLVSSNPNELIRRKCDLL
jgi:hypothetical protein